MAPRPTVLAALLAVLLGLAPAAYAQTEALDPTPTPAPAAEPSPDGDAPAEDAGEVGAPPDGASAEVRRVYRDYRRDGLIDPCAHPLRALRDTRDSITEDFEREFPDFTESVQAAIEERRTRDCEAEAQEDEPAAEDDDPEPRERDTPNRDPRPAPAPAPAPAPPPDPAPPAPLPPPPAPSDALPPDPLQTEPLPEVQTPAPLPESGAPDPVAPAPVPPAPAVPAAPEEADVAPEPASPPIPIYGMAVGGGLLALGGLLLPFATAPAGRRTAAFRHAWSEAGYRLRGAWLDFRDWLRVGR